MTNRDILLKLISDHSLTAQQVAELMGTKTGTVYAWTCKNDYRQIPDTKLQLLQILVEG